MDKTIDELVGFFKYEFGQEIKVNGISARGVVLDASDKIGEYDDKYIMLDTIINTGAVIDYKDKKHLVISDINKKINSYVGEIRPCNHKIAFNYLGSVKWFDVIIEAKDFSIDAGKVISLPQGEIVVYIQENMQSLKAALEQRFLNTGRAWKITGIDRTKVGLIKFHCEITAINDYDNFELDIADYYKYLHKYALSVSNQQPVCVALGKTTQLIFIVTDSGQQVLALPEMTCTSSDEAIATVDSTGMITGIVNGTASITTTIVDYPEVTITIPVEVAGSVQPSYSVTITFTGSAQIYVGGNAKTLTAHVFNNGTEVADKLVTWSLSNQDGSTTAMANITSATDLICKVQAVNNKANLNKYVVLIAALSDDTTVFIDLAIKLISVM